MSDTTIELVDIEAPYQGIRTIPLVDAIREFNLDSYEIEDIRAGKIVWYEREVGITLFVEEENSGKG